MVNVSLCLGLDSAKVSTMRGGAKFRGAIWTVFPSGFEKNDFCIDNQRVKWCFFAGWGFFQCPPQAPQLSQLSQISVIKIDFATNRRQWVRRFRLYIVATLLTTSKIRFHKLRSVITATLCMLGPAGAWRQPCKGIKIHTSVKVRFKQMTKSPS